MNHKPPFETQFRVYYEDTDAGGIVYYANYLKFAERARTEYLRKVEISQNKLILDNDIMFVVREVNVKYKQPAKLDDLITVATIVSNIKSASLSMHQDILLNDQLLVQLQVNIACVNAKMKPVKIPKNIVDLL